MDKTVSLGASIGVLVVTVILIAVSVYQGIGVFYPLAAGFVLCSGVVIKSGYSIKELYKMIKEGIFKTYNIMIILSLIGILIGVWIAGGVVPAMIYYGFKLINLKFFLVTVFFVCSLISMVLGTAVGTVSTVGIAFLGIGSGLDFSLPLVAGAVISGAFVGDRTSPLSGAANLVAAMTGTEVTGNIKHLFSTAIPAYLLSALVYMLAGLKFGGEGDLTRIFVLQGLLEENFLLPLYTLIPPALILVLALFRIKTMHNLLIGIVSGSMLAVFVQRVPIGRVLLSMIIGCKVNTGVTELDGILSGGGLIVMFNMLIIIVVASALSGVLYSSGIIDRIMGGFLEGIKSRKMLIFKTVFVSFLSALLGCNQAIAIIMPSQIMRDHYHRLGVSSKTFARTLSDSAVLLSPLVPWNIAGLAPAAIMGMGVVDFLPFAVFCYITPLVTLLYGWKGWMITEKSSQSLS